MMREYRRGRDTTGARLAGNDRFAATIAKRIVNAVELCSDRETHLDEQLVHQLTREFKEVMEEYLAADSAKRLPTKSSLKLEIAQKKQLHRPLTVEERRREDLAHDPDMQSTQRMFKGIEAEMDKDPKLRMKMEELRTRAALAVRIADLRKESGLTQAQLADRLGRTQPQIARMESYGYLSTVRSLVDFVSACGKKLVIRFE